MKVVEKMTNKTIKINVVIEYNYNLDKIKEIIKQIIDIDGVEKLEIENNN